MKQKLITVTLIASALIFILSACTAPSRSSSDGEVMDFTLNDVNGNTIQLSDFKGKVVILDFWATWCGPCIQEIPTFNKLADYAQSKKEFVLLTIVNESGDEEEVKEFMRDSGINYAVLIGNMDTVRRFGVIGYPSTFIVDKKGSVAARVFGSQRNLYNILLNEVSKL